MQEVADGEGSGSVGHPGVGECGEVAGVDSVIVIEVACSVEQGVAR
jgi:hypothetical protein